MFKFKTKRIKPLRRAINTKKGVHPVEQEYSIHLTFRDGEGRSREAVYTCFNDDLTDEARHKDMKDHLSNLINSEKYNDR